MTARPRQRPWYLVLSLLGALALGTRGASDGWGRIALYRGKVDPSAALIGITDDADRAAVQARVESFIATVDAAKPRGWPLAVATLVIGGAMMFFGVRAMSGSRSARNALLQLVAAQAGLAIADFWLYRDVVDAELRVSAAQQAAFIHQGSLERKEAEEAVRVTATIFRAATPIRLGLLTLGSTLVIIGLTRRRSRIFFDEAAAALEER
jgi:hypothetical protein